LLILLPLSMAFATFAGDRRPFQVSKLVIENPAARVEVVKLQAPVSLSTVEPIIAIDRQLDNPEVLPSLSLPIDAPEEPSDGGH
jgi:hypothetical protein